ncbi:choice-of-anchor D domain-containing protein [Clostridium oryzae]|uniref:Fibronectin type-III domain-containing protein n=1 Tax=Clostridium oryzae TaxID=1450648 RepID=A0A1V4IVD1_9CLOT|nr:choice-of-anchor D domain-containing protein [Clostridium oryzae]OPJ63745.1 hypothetical protein CLORY_09290 [Clostridium oryzae]
MKKSIKKITATTVMLLMTLGILMNLGEVKVYAWNSSKYDGRNLVVNGDGDGGGGGAAGNINPWMDSNGKFTLQNLSDMGYTPSPNGGYSFDYYPGAASTDTAYQDIDVSDISQEVDSSDVAFNLSGYMSKLFSNSTAKIEADFFDAGNQKIGSKTLVDYSTDAVKDATGNYIMDWQQKSASGTIPSGTRKIRVSLIADIPSIVDPVAGPIESIEFIEFDGIELKLSQKAKAINVKGNSKVILNQDITPSSSDDTDFGNADIATGSVKKTFTIESTGAYALNLSGIPKVTVGGTNAGDFTVSQPTASSIAVGGSITFQVTFDPTTIGTKTASISIANDDSDSGQNSYTFNIQGTGTAAPVISIEGNNTIIANGDTTPIVSDDTDFGTLKLSEAGITKTYAIKNNGTKALTIIGPVTISGANKDDFSVKPSAAGTTITAGGSITIEVTFNPAATGTKTATINIPSDDVTKNPYYFNIKGVGIDVPVVTTAAASAIKYNTASVGGEVTSDGNSVVTERGVVYGTKTDPTIASDTKVNATSSGTGAFLVSLSTLQPNTTYHARAYAKNSAGVSYGSDVSFTTSSEPLAINSSALPSGTVGTAYSTKITSTGGKGNKTYSKVSGALPQGLTLSTDGTLSGTPINVETTTFTVSVTDELAATVSKSFTVTINPITSPPVVTPTTPVPSETVEEIPADVTGGSSDGVISQITVNRTTESDGTKSDAVTYGENTAKDTVEKLSEACKTKATINIPDAQDEVSETTVAIPNSSLNVLADGSVGIGIETENGRVELPAQSVQYAANNINGDLYFKLVPMKTDEEKKEIVDRAEGQSVISTVFRTGTLSIIGRPMAIETNLSSTPVDIILPLDGVGIPTNAKKRQAFLDKLGIYIEHSDGDKELIHGEIVQYKDGVLGIKFTVTKFSVFTIVKGDKIIKQSSECKILKVKTPTAAQISGTKLSAKVKYKTGKIKVEVSVSKKASWKLYKDAACTKEIANKKLNLSVGNNKAYIKVTAEDGVSSKIYSLVVNRKKKTDKK